MTESQKFVLRFLTWLTVFLLGSPVPAAAADESIESLLSSGMAHQQQGNLPAARLDFEKAAALAGKKDPDSIEYADCLNTLATVIYSQNDYASAKKIFEKLVAIYEKTGDKSTKYATTLTTYAGLLDALGQGEQAKATYRNVLSILEAQNPRSPLEIARAYNSLACCLEDKGEFDEASKLFRQAIDIQAAHDATSLDYADTLNNLGVLCMDTGKLDAAKDYLQKALNTYTTRCGPFHETTAGAMTNLGDVCMLQNDRAAAARYYLNAAQAIDRYFALALPGMSVAEQQAELGARSREQSSRLLSSLQGKDLFTAYDILCGWKGALIAALEEESALQRNAKTDEERSKLQALNTVRTQLAAWYQQIGNVSLHQWQTKNDELTTKKEQLERQCWDGREHSRIRCATSDLQKALQADEALIDIYKYQAIDDHLQRIDKYVAFVICKEAGSTVIDLREAAPLEALHANWINQVTDEKAAVDSWVQLQMKLQACIDTLPAGITKAWICPDGELARIPWQLLCNIRPQLQLAQLNSPRELLHLRSTASQLESSGPLTAVGGVEFNAKISPIDSKSAIQLTPLPATLEEARTIADMARNTNVKAAIELYDVNATKGNLLAALPKSSYAHLATHGFFLDESTMNALRRVNPQIPSSQASRGIVLRSKQGDDESLYRNPLVESGIALAGANRCTDSGDYRPGMLTAEEFVGVDLRKCKLITLSACDTGRGAQVTGQGVLGLRAAIMAAGARSVLMSLWRVPDQSTALLMKEFYSNLWIKHMPPASALQAAQRALAMRLPQSPHAWAGWVLVGEGWPTIPPNDDSSRSMAAH